jgi:5'-nucleotidase
MVLPLNSFHIDVACLGNHDMDFEEEQSLKLQKQTNFPWVLSNFFYKGTTDRLLECK